MRNTNFMQFNKKLIPLILASLLSGQVLANELNKDFSENNPVVNQIKVDEDFDPNGITFSADADSKENDCLYHFPLEAVAHTHSKKMAENTIMLCYANFVSFVSSDTKTPLLVAEHITQPLLVESYNHRDKVKVRFHRETRLPQRAQAFDEMYQPTVYENSPYKMATLASPYYQISYFDVDNTFSFANVLPLNAELRNGLWLGIEKALRLYVYDVAQEGYIASGSYYDPKQVNYRIGGVNGVAVPTYVYKAFYFPSKAIASAYWIKNDNSGKYEIISIEELKNRTGIDVFPNLMANIKKKAVYPPKPYYGEENYLGAAKEFMGEY